MAYPIRKYGHVRFVGRPIRILMAARFVVHKQHVISAACACWYRSASWRLTLAGDGPLKAEMEQLSAFVLAFRIESPFTGDTDQVSSLLADTDIFVLSSVSKVYR